MRREVALALALVVTLVLVTALTGGEAREEGRAGSSYESGPGGAKALYLVLERLGHRVERRAEPLGDPGDARMVFVLSPDASLEGADWAGLRAWVERGGTLVYGPSDAEVDPRALRDRFGVRVLRFGMPLPEREVLVAEALAPARHLLAEDMASVRVEGEQAGEQAGWSALAADAFEAGAAGQPRRAGPGRRALIAVAERAMGAGRVIALSGAPVASNATLGQSDNALFWAALVARAVGDPAQGGRVVFDEWSHGYGKREPVLDANPRLAALAAVVAALAALAYLWGAGRRLGPPSLEPAPPRLASIEQVEMLARFYQKAGVRPPAGF